MASGPRAADRKGVCTPVVQTPPLAQLRGVFGGRSRKAARRGSPDPARLPGRRERTSRWLESHWIARRFHGRAKRSLLRAGRAPAGSGPVGLRLGSDWEPWSVGSRCCESPAEGARGFQRQATRGGGSTWSASLEGLSPEHGICGCNLGPLLPQRCRRTAGKTRTRCSPSPFRAQFRRGV